MGKLIIFHPFLHSCFTFFVFCILIKPTLPMEQKTLISHLNSVISCTLMVVCRRETEMKSENLNELEKESSFCELNKL
jgi:hypothetical protein